MDQDKIEAMRRRLDAHPVGREWRAGAQFPLEKLIRFEDGTFVIHGDAFGGGHLTSAHWHESGSGFPVISLRSILPSWVPVDEPAIGCLYLTELSLRSQCDVRFPPPWLAEPCCRLAAGEPDTLATITLQWVDLRSQGGTYSPRAFFDP